jgi:hypothetical protein
MFGGTSSKATWWKGAVRDNQASLTSLDAAQYWIQGFLAATRELTDAHATRIVCESLKKILKDASSGDARDGILAAAKILETRAGEETTITGIAQNLPEEVRKRFTDNLQLPIHQLETPFNIEPTIIERQFRYRVLFLEGSFSVKGPEEEFDEVVQVRQTPTQGVVEVTLKGKVAGMKILTR